MGRLSVIGFGPGGWEHMTHLCQWRLRDCDIIVGYTGYIKLLCPLFPDKDYYETPMTRERERCAKAIDLAQEGKTVCIVSSGDSGVYGMAGLVLELAEDLSDLEIEVIPGVTAALGGAALLGAPLGHDFAVVSLSDLLTPWEIIEKRLRGAAAGDFVICLYNPASVKRSGHLRAACDILLEILPSSRLCGVAGNIGREGQTVFLLTLKQLRDFQANMTQTVFIGNAQTRNIGRYMVTPRGYRDG